MRLFKGLFFVWTLAGRYDMGQGYQHLLTKECDTAPFATNLIKVFAITPVIFARPVLRLRSHQDGCSRHSEQFRFATLQYTLNCPLIRTNPHQYIYNHVEYIVS